MLYSFILTNQCYITYVILQNSREENEKKLGILALTAVLGTGAYGASIDHIQTYTPEYLGNQAQNGMINNVSVYYNPAGLMQLERGTYFMAECRLHLVLKK